MTISSGIALSSNYYSAGESKPGRTPCEGGPEVYGATPGSGDEGELVSLSLRFQNPSTEEETPVLYPREKLDEIMKGTRFLVIDDGGTGFSDDERSALLSDSRFSAKLNVAVQAHEIITRYESLLGEPLKWPSGYFDYYLHETDYAAEKLASEGLDEQRKEKYQSFINDLSRVNEAYRMDSSRVFITTGGINEGRMPSFNAARLDVTLTPYPSRRDSFVMLNPALEIDSLAHELGHLSNACIRPGWDEAHYNADGDFETCAIRESVADLTALFQSLSSQSERVKVLEETAGDPAQSNRASRIAEEGGGDLLHRYFAEQGTAPAERYLRDLANDYVYVPREEAPPLIAGEPNAGCLHNDVYSYSQIFSGALYDIMTALYQKLSEGHDDKQEALKNASTITASLMVKSLEIAPWWKPDFKTLAACMIKSDVMENEGAYGAVIEEAFAGRNILSREQASAAREELSCLPALRSDEIPREKTAEYLMAKGLLAPAEGMSCTIAENRINSRGERTLIYTMEKPFAGDPSSLPFDMSTAYYGDICDLTPDVTERGSLVLRFNSSGDLIYALREGFQPVDRAQSYLRLDRGGPAA